MKIIIIVILYICLHWQASSQYVVDTLYKYNYSDAEKLTPSLMVVYTYNNMCKEETTQGFDWKEKKKVWNKSITRTSTYNSAGKILNMVGQMNNTLLALIAWRSIVILYYYNADNLMDSMVVNYIGRTANDIRMVFIFKYNADGTEAESYVSGTYKNDLFKDGWVKSVNRYNDHKKLTESVTNVWDNNTKTPGEYISKYSYNYDSNDSLITSVWESFEENEWVKINSTLNEYDNNGLLKQTINRGWNKKTGTWEEGSRVTPQYNEVGLKISELLEDWSTEKRGWVKSTLEKYVYKKCR